MNSVEPGVFVIPVGNEETPEQSALRECLGAVFQGKTDIEAIQIAGALIAYTRDHVLSSLGAIRRTAALTAKEKMTAEELAKATSLSRVTITRLLTEARNY